MLMSGSDDITGSCLLAWLESQYARVNDVPWRDLATNSAGYRQRTMIFNLTGHEEPLANVVRCLNKNRQRISGNRVVILADNDLAKLCTELLSLEQVGVLTDKSPLCDFSRLLSPEAVCWNPRLSRSQKKLTDREQEVLSLLVKGYAPKEISTLIGLKYKTVQTHKMNIIVKLKLANSAELNKLIVRYNRPLSILT